MRFKVFINELQRRHVLKAAVAYLVVAWLVVQVLSILIPAFEFPYRTLQISILIMMIGFPIWLLINWFYDITEEGIIRVSRQDYESETLSKKNVNLNKVIIITLSIIVVILLVNTFRIQADNSGNNTSEASMIPDLSYSIAVLAFADMSPEHDKEYFADGMSEEILNRLAKCKELKVIGRTSSFSYKNKSVTHDVIGKELGVGYILEGSIRQSGDIFRITAQLIDVSDGSHIWSDTFDRTMEDALIVQDEIAAIVANRLEVTLLTEELRERRLDPKAYEFYLKSREQINLLQKSSTLKADSLIRASIELDNTYSPSWSLLAQVLFAKTYHYFLMDHASGYEAGVLAAQKSLEIDPSNAMGLVWQSLFNWQDRNVEKAISQMSTALEMAPNNPRILERAGNLALRTNRLELAQKHYEKAMILDPKSTMAIKRMAFVRWTEGDLKSAESLILKAYEFGLPDLLKNYELAILNRDKGDLEQAVAWMEKETDPYLRNLLECSLQFAMKNEEEALRILEKIKYMPYDVLGSKYVDSGPEHDYEIACLYAYMGAQDSAFVYLDKAYENVTNWPQGFFTMPDFNKLKADPRWESYLKRMAEDFEYDFLGNEQ